MERWRAAVRCLSLPCPSRSVYTSWQDIVPSARGAATHTSTQTAQTWTMIISILRAMPRKGTMHYLGNRLESHSPAQTAPRSPYMALMLAVSGASQLQCSQGVQMQHGRMKLLAAA